MKTWMIQALQKKEVPDEYELKVGNCLNKFIKGNPHLHHIDLTGCGLTGHVLEEIAKALRKSRALVGIHLSENPGLSPQVKEYLFNRVHCKKSDFEDLRIIDLRRHFESKLRHDPQHAHKLRQESIAYREIKTRKLHASK